jgi:hypothetical protein
MGSFVKLNNNNFVIQGVSLVNEIFTVNNIEIEQIGINFLNNLYKTNDVWKKTSYNTRGGIYYEADNNTPSIDQSKAFRKNYAGIGYYYDSIRDAFIPPKPFPSWTLNEESCLWDSPVPYPDMPNIPEPYIWYNRYFWNEEIVNWVLQKPFESWQLIEDSYYISPTPYPSDGKMYTWNEDILNWQEINF